MKHPTQLLLLAVVVLTGALGYALGRGARLSAELEEANRLNRELIHMIEECVGQGKGNTFYIVD